MTESDKSLLFICLIIIISVVTYNVYYAPSPSSTMAEGAHSAYAVANDKYLTLLEGVLTNSLFPELGTCAGTNCVDRAPYNDENRMGGNDWPPHGLTMAGNMRLRNVRYVIDEVVKNSVPGDFVELGVWRGGVCMFARAQFDLLGQTDREVILLDVFGEIGLYDVSRNFCVEPPFIARPYSLLPPLFFHPAFFILRTRLTRPRASLPFPWTP